MDRKKRRLVTGVVVTGAVAVCVASAVCLNAKMGGQNVRIACVGDSITYGAYLENRRENCYPAVLQRLLGEKYRVQNFGFNGSTVQSTGDRPYREQKKFRDSLKFSPDIVLLMLGTNDTKPENWTDIANFMSDYEALIQSYEELPSEPEICLMTPSAVFKGGRKKRSYEILDELVRQEREYIIKLGEEKNLQVIDIYKLTEENPQWYRLDGVHPDARGARAIAEYVCGQIE